MRHLIVVVCLLAAATCGAQTATYNYAGGGNYGGLYYSPIINGPNGHRTVEEEDRLADELAAERRRQAHWDSLSPWQREQERKRAQMRVEIKHDVFAAKQERKQQMLVAKTGKTQPKKEVAQPVKQTAPARQPASPAAPPAKVSGRPGDVKKQGH